MTNNELAEFAGHILALGAYVWVFWQLWPFAKAALEMVR